MLKYSKISLRLFHAFDHLKDITTMSIIISIIGDATRPFLVLMCQQSFLKTATVTCFARHLADSQLSGPFIYHIHVIFSDINQTLNWPASFCHMNMTTFIPIKLSVWTNR